jgi:hypothetical protein
VTRTFCYCVATLAFVMAAAIAPATAQISFPWSRSPPAAAAKPAAPTGPHLIGNWTGQLTPGGSSTTINFELAVTSAGTETKYDTKYPDLDCTGKLRRTGSSKSYAFFVEIITKGRVDKGGQCRDGSITIARQGDNLNLVWFGSSPDSVTLAYGNLSKKQP